MPRAHPGRVESGAADPIGQVGWTTATPVVNCSSSVEPVNAVVEDCPPATHWATRSK
jgi:hypothetical protein